MEIVAKPSLVFMSEAELIVELARLEQELLRVEPDSPEEDSLWAEVERVEDALGVEVLKHLALAS